MSLSAQGIKLLQPSGGSVTALCILGAISQVTDSILHRFAFPPLVKISRGIKPELT